MMRLVSKKLLSALLILCLLAAGATAAAEVEPEAMAAQELVVGYLAPAAAEGERGALCADAFTSAAEQAGAASVRVFYDPETAPDAESEAGEDGAEAEQSTALRALEELLERDPDGIVAAPESLEQAVELAEAAEAAGVPMVIEGIDMAPAYPPTPDPEDEEDRPYVANVLYNDAAAYAAAKWLEEYADSPLMLHCALPRRAGEGSTGVNRALAEAVYLQLADEVVAEEDSVEAGRAAVRLMYNTYTMFYCVLADSEALAEGCAQELREAGEDLPIAAIASTPDAVKLLDSGDVDMLASEPASTEGEAAFQALWEYLTAGTIPDGESRRIELPAHITVGGQGPRPHAAALE